MKGKFSIITAFTKSNRGIGIKNRLPWRIKEDMEWFKKITTQKYPEYPDGNSVIMGRNTWESLPEKFKPLPNRYNLILSRSFAGSSSDDWINSLCAELDDKDYPNTTWINQIDAITDCMLQSQSDKWFKHFVIGGQSIYEQTIGLPECEMLYITEIDDTVYNNGEPIVCDTFFPKIPKHFKKTDEIRGKTPGVTFQTWTNIGNYQSSEYQYINMVKRIIEEGEETVGRNGKVLSVFGDFQHKFDLREGFPLLTTKRMAFGSIMKELLFFLRGDTNAKHLSDQGVRIWDGNTSRQFLDQRGLTEYKEGDMGPMYGWNWRNFGAEYKGCDSDYSNEGFDQLRVLIENITNDPNSRRLLLTTFDPSKVSQSVLAPCHGLTVQFNVSGGKYLDCKMYQRSIDTALGYPYNIASYAAFIHIMGMVSGLVPRNLYMTLGDTHIYEQHIEKVKRHFERVPLEYPRLRYTGDVRNVGKFDTVEDKLKWIENLKPEDFELKGYNYHPGIKMDMVA